jgi:hypothetical protein
VPLVAALLLVGLLAVPLTSYVRYISQPSSLPLSIRSIEWVRTHHGAWFVSTVERYYYSWTAPKKGGPALTALPHVGAGVAVAKVRHNVVAYLPPPIAPVVTPALKGEGVWRSTGALIGGAPPLLVTVFRPEPAYPRLLASVAWINTRLTQLALYPGRYQPPAGSPRGPMEVPQDQRRRLLATFNSGFQFADAHGGFVVNGHVYEPLIAGQGTLVMYRDGRVDVLSWSGGSSPGADVVLARQNLPLIVSAGQPNPKLGVARLWGATLGNAVRVWRSGVGIDARGNLIYLAAPSQTAASLAAALIHAGAVRAIELDINAEWPSFITYAQPGARSPQKLVPNVMQPATRYLTPDDRDFFAVFVRAAGAGFAVPFR